MPFSQVRRPTIHTEIVNEIKRLIIEGEYRPGDRLPSEREMAALMKCGRPSVREAVRSLASVGLLKITPRGVFVNSRLDDDVMEPLSCTVIMSQPDFERLYEARLIIETGAVDLAARRASPEGLAAMRRALDRMTEAGDEEAYYDADVAFHEAIMEAADNPVLLSIFRALRHLLRAQIKAKLRKISGSGQVRLSDAVEKHRRLAHEEHCGILEAVEAGEGERAVELMKSHISGACDSFLGV